jgi:thiamine-monophosphate kinase
VTRRGEFELIADVFGPLADDPSALNLGDDGAIVPTRVGMDLVVTTDAMVEGRHFAADFPPGLLAQKLLRSNLSDLAAMGADPSAYTLTVALPTPPPEDWIEKFAQGLGRDQARYGLALIGGDTVAATGDHDKWFSVTMFGHVEPGQALRRSGAKPGDTIFVSGTIGDAMIGYEIGQGQHSTMQPESLEFLKTRLYLPSPRVKLGRGLHGLATAAIDVSDGLVADLGHICDQSGVGAEVSAARVPLSAAGGEALALDPSIADRRLVWGEDYELIFCTDPSLGEEIDWLTMRLGTGVAAIGRITPGSGVRFLDSKGEQIAFASTGYRHF